MNSVVKQTKIKNGICVFVRAAVFISALSRSTTEYISKLNSTPILTTHHTRTHFMIHAHLLLGLPSRYLPAVGFPTKMFAVFVSITLATCPAPLTWWISLFCCPHRCFQALVTRGLSSNRVCVAHPYRTTSKLKTAGLYTWIFKVTGTIKGFWQLNFLPISSGT